MVFHSPGPCIHCHGRPPEIAIAVATLVGDVHSGEHYSILIEKLKVSAASGSSATFLLPSKQLLFVHFKLKTQYSYTMRFINRSTGL